jgi:hypothetical protein
MKAKTGMLLKSTLLFLAAVVAAGDVRGQGAIYLNDYDPGTGIFLQSGGALVPAPQGTAVEVLTGPTSNSLTPVLNASPSPGTVFVVGSGDVAANADGGSAFDGGYGYSSIPAFSEGWIELLGSVTVGNVSYIGSRQWQQAVGGPKPPDASLPTLVSLAQPAALILQPVPEPSTFNLGALAVAISFRLCHRRRPNFA